MSFSEKLFFIIFQGCFTVQLSRFLLNLFDSVCCALPRQRVLSYQRYILLSTLFCNFFQKNTNYLFSTISWCFVSGRPQEIFCILSSDTKTTLSRTGLSNGEGGIWTLAPRKRPTPLAGAPLQPLEYFSVLLNFILYQYKVATSIRDAKVIIHKWFLFVNWFYLSFSSF